MESGESNDILLWQAFKEGDRDAYAHIYQRYFKNLYEYGFRINDDKYLVQDCIHDLFVKLWNNKSTLGNVKSIKPYLLVSLRSTIYNKTKQEDKITSVDIEDDRRFEMTFLAETTFAEKENTSEQSKKLLEALNRLTPRQKEIIYLKYFEELEYEEIANIMNISVKAAYKLSARAIEAFRLLLNISRSTLVILLTLAKVELFNS